MLQLSMLAWLDLSMLWSSTQSKGKEHNNELFLCYVFPGKCFGRVRKLGSEQLQEKQLLCFCPNTNRQKRVDFEVLLVIMWMELFMVIWLSPFLNLGTWHKTSRCLEMAKGMNLLFSLLHMRELEMGWAPTDVPSWFIKNKNIFCFPTEGDWREVAEFLYLKRQKTCVSNPKLAQRKLLSPSRNQLFCWRKKVHVHWYFSFFRAWCKKF